MMELIRSQNLTLCTAVITLKRLQVLMSVSGNSSSLPAPGIKPSKSGTMSPRLLKYLISFQKTLLLLHSIQVVSMSSFQLKIRFCWWTCFPSHSINSKISSKKTAMKSNSATVVTCLQPLTKTMPFTFTTSTLERTHLTTNARVISKELDLSTGSKMTWDSYLLVMVVMFSSGILST